MLKNGQLTAKYVEKPWGSEVWICENDTYAGKILHIKKGCKLSLQYHKVKKETLYLYKGLCNITVGDKTVLMGVGEVWEIPPKTIHRLEAVNDSDIFEISTPELDDVIRLSDEYGRVKIENEEQSVDI